MTEPNLAVEKEKLRRQMLHKRDALTPAEIQRKSLQVISNVLSLSEFQTAKIVACYVNKGSEAETKPIIRNILSSSKKVLVPTVTGERDLVFSELRSLEELVLGTFGILEPQPDLTRPRSLETVDLAFIPGIVWDSEGYRVGWGKGYFDAVLEKLPSWATSIGLSYDQQVVDRVPREEFDLPVDLVVTETRVIRP